MPNSIPISTINWVKIWFTTQPAIFMPEINKARLIDFLENNPNRILTCIFSSKLLNDIGKRDFKKFKKTVAKYKNIHFIDFNCNDFLIGLDEIEMRLYEIAKAELKHLHKGGNAAAASDIVRLLFSCYRHGIYTDFDVYITPTEIISISETLTVKPDQSLFMPYFAESESWNNDTIIITSHSTLLSRLQTTIAANYLSPPTPATLKKIEMILNEFFINHYKKTHEQKEPSERLNLIMHEVIDKLHSITEAATMDDSSFHFFAPKTKIWIFEFRNYLLEKRLSLSETDHEALVYMKWAIEVCITCITGPGVFALMMAAPIGDYTTESVQIPKELRKIIYCQNTALHESERNNPSLQLYPISNGKIGCDTSWISTVDEATKTPRFSGYGKH